jgi:hypothetical protein
MRKYEFRYTGGRFPEPAGEVARDAELFDTVLDEMRGLFRQRNNVYRSQFRQQGLGGVLSWIAVNMQRVSSLLSDGPTSEQDEDLTENLLDMAVYAALGALLSHYTEPQTAQCKHLYATRDISDDRAGMNTHQLWCLLCGSKAKIVLATEE